MGYAQERNEMRFPVRGIYGNLRTIRDVRVLNLSRGGLAFETPHRLTVGEDYFIEVAYRNQKASLAVSLRWCSRKRGLPRAATPIYQAGGCFVDALPSSRDGLWAWMLDAAGADPSGDSGVRLAPGE